MDTDRMMKVVKKLLLTKSLQKSSDKLRNLQTGDHGERKNLRILQDPPDPPNVQAKNQVSQFINLERGLRDYRKNRKP